VYGFAAGLANKTVGSSIRLAMKQEEVEKKLSVQLGYTSKSLLDYASAQQKVTAFGDEEVIGVMGQISAFTKNEEQIKSLTKATLDLSEGMGIPLNDAGLLVAKTFGSSTNSMSRYGIAVEGTAGSEERLVNLTEALNAKYGGLSENIDTTGKALKQMGNALGDAGEEIGEAFLPITKKFAVGMTKLTHETLIPFINTVKRINVKQTVKNFVQNMDVLREFLVGQVTLIVKLFAGLGKRLGGKLLDILPTMVKFVGDLVLKVGETLSAGLELLSAKTIRAIAGFFREPKKMFNNLVSFIFKGLNVVIDLINPFLEKFGGGIDKLVDIPKQKLDETKWDKLVEDRLKAFQATDVWKTISNTWEGSGDDLNLILSAMGDNFQETIANLIALNPADASGSGSGGGAGKNNILGMTDDEMKNMIDMWGQYNTAVMGVANAYESLMMQGIAQARQKELDDANSMKSERKKQQAIDEINKRYDKKVKKQKEELKHIKVAEAISNTALAITKYLSEGKTAMAYIAGVQGALQIATIKAQKYEYGGLVGGRRHSQGGTMIEAERGEFVMSRRAVDAIGVEAMNRINEGGSPGTNIVINNPILSKDVVEDELIPQIKNAIRRGADLGVR
jgi:hypothetical protein